jgi:hypothetical protein
MTSPPSSKPTVTLERGDLLRREQPARGGMFHDPRVRQHICDLRHSRASLAGAAASCPPVQSFGYRVSDLVAPVGDCL